MNLDNFCACFQHGDACKGSSSFRAIALNSSYSLHRHIFDTFMFAQVTAENQLFFLLTFTLRGVSNKPCILPILVFRDFLGF